MSRSCHSATFSSAGTTVERTRRARPVKFSASTGLRLCGIAEEPFCPGAKYSSASRTSVRCRWRISVASRSTPAAIRASVMKYWAWRSRGITWVEIGSGSRPSCLATWASTAGSILAKVPTAPEMAQVAISRRAASEPVAVAGELGIVPGELQAEGRRLGVDAVAAADGRGQFMLEGAPLQRRQQRIEIGQQQIGGLFQLHRKSGVEHVARGHPLMHEARFGADMLGEVGQEGDHVVVGLALDLRRSVRPRRRRVPIARAPRSRG